MITMDTFFQSLFFIVNAIMSGSNKCKYIGKIYVARVIYKTHRFRRCFVLILYGCESHLTVNALHWRFISVTISFLQDAHVIVAIFH